MQYWYLDSKDKITMLMLDKSYYDYDYEEQEEVEVAKTYDESVKSEVEIKSLLHRFGWGMSKAEMLQLEVRQEEKNKKLKAK